MADSSRVIIKNSHVIDATSQEPRELTVVVEGTNIVDLVPPGSPVSSGDAQEIDLRGGWLLPGLWDVHTHIGRGIPDPGWRDESIAERTTRAGRDCMNALALGITGMRVVGEREYVDVAWKRAFDSGLFIGPSLFTCGWFITTTAGHFLRSGTAKEVDGPTEFRRAIRENIKNGVDFIKLNLTGGIMGPPWDGMQSTFPTPDEIDAAFEICHQRGFKVVAHAGGTHGIKMAVAHGAWTLEHGYVLDDEAVTMMAEAGTYFVPTLGLSHLNRGPAYAESEIEHAWAEAHPAPPDYAARAVVAAEAHAAGFKKALDAGVPIANGSDLALPDGGLLELAQLVRRGMTEWQAIVAATKTSAEVCEASDRRGTVEIGKAADLLAVGSNPLENIENVRDVKLVMKDGQIVVQN
ncbi:MAG: amidohydrolase family protein [Dehalococcoidia bacterium]|nr:amidohydrolase family protein [Dehalococcoidia bacterium]